MNVELSIYEYIIETRGWDAIDITEDVEDAIRKSRLTSGVATYLHRRKNAL